MAMPLIISCVANSTREPYQGPDPEKIINVQADANGIYQGARQWIAENFKSANDVIQYQDQSTTTVIGRGRQQGLCVLPSGEMVALSTTHPAQCFVVRDIEFVLKVEAKDNRMRVSIPSILEVWPASQYGSGGSEPAGATTVEILGPELLSYGDLIKEYVETGVSDNNW